MRIVHLSEHPIPYDIHMFGQTFVIMYLSKDPPKDVENYILMRDRERLSEEDFKIIKEGFEDLFGAKLVRYVPRIRINEAQSNSPLKEALSEILEKKSIIVDHYQSTRHLRAVKSLKTMYIPYFHVPYSISGLYPKTHKMKIFESISPQFSILVSETIMEDYKIHLKGVRRFYVIKNGVPDKLYRPINRKYSEYYKKTLSIDPEKIVVGYVGRMTELKGKDIMLEFIKQIFNKRIGKRITFVFACSNGEDRRKFIKAIETMIERGEIPEDSDIRVYVDLSKILDPRSPPVRKSSYNDKIVKIFSSQIEKEGVSDSRIFRGFLNFPINRIIDIYFHPSLEEAFPLAVLEAKMCGNYVVASSSGGTLETLIGYNKVTVFNIPQKIREIGRILSGGNFPERSKDLSEYYIGVIKISKSLVKIVEDIIRRRAYEEEPVISVKRTDEDIRREFYEVLEREKVI